MNNLTNTRMIDASASINNFFNDLYRLSQASHINYPGGDLDFAVHLSDLLFANINRVLYSPDTTLLIPTNKHTYVKPREFYPLVDPWDDLPERKFYHYEILYFDSMRNFYMMMDDHLDDPDNLVVINEIRVIRNQWEYDMNYHMKMFTLKISELPYYLRSDLNL